MLPWLLGDAMSTQAIAHLIREAALEMRRVTKAGPYRLADGGEHRIEDMIGPDGCAPLLPYRVAVRGTVRELRALDPQAAAAQACHGRDPYTGEVNPVVVTDIITGRTSRWTVAPCLTWDARELVDEG